jgi:hypothetical protein
MERNPILPENGALTAVLVCALINWLCAFIEHISLATSYSSWLMALFAIEAALLSFSDARLSLVFA